jgi:hypothetical protein
MEGTSELYVNNHTMKPSPTLLFKLSGGDL